MVWLNAHNCVLFSMVGVRIRFSVWLVIGNAHCPLSLSLSRVCDSDRRTTTTRLPVR